MQSRGHNTAQVVHTCVKNLRCMHMLTLLAHYGPVTAVRLLQDCVLSASGPVLRVHRRDTFAETASSRVFARNKIHGIVVGSGRVCVFGGRSVAVAPIPAVLAGTADWTEHALGDWIMAAAFTPTALLVLSAHNTVTEVALPLWDIVATHECGEKLLLYSGAIHVLPDRVLVAAGTVMNGVSVWDLSGAIVSTCTGHLGSIFSVAFLDSGDHVVSCSDDRSVRMWHTASGELAATGWGHSARIWHVQVDGDRVLLTAEDMTVRVWSREGAELVSTPIEAHLGRHVWSGDMDRDVVVSGGADGRVRLHSLVQEPTVVESIEEIGRQCNTVLAPAILKLYACAGPVLLAAASSGHLLRKEFGSSWKVLLQDDRFKDFSVVSLLSPTGPFVVSSRSGFQYVVDGEEVRGHEQTAFDTRPILAVLSAHQHTLLVCPNPQYPLVLKHWGESQTHQLDRPPKFTPTALAVDPANQWAFVGGRGAVVVLYNLATRSLVVSPRLTRGDAVSSVRVVSSAPGSTTVVATIRDGLYVYLRTDGSGLRMLHRNHLHRGFVEGSFDHDGQLMLYGFHSSRFYIWNESNQTEVFSEACGGAHRQWTLGDGVFVYSRASDLCHRGFALGPTLVRNGTHGREVRDIAIRGDLVVTGGEDATVRLYTLHHQTLTPTWQLRHHVAGLQKVGFVDDLLVTSAGREELVVWKVEDGYVYDWTRVEPTTKTPDLRITDFGSVSRENHHLLALAYSDSTIRVFLLDRQLGECKAVASTSYTTCCLWKIDLVEVGGKEYVVTGASDGHVAVWELCEGGLESRGRVQVHQNGIKDWAVLPGSPGVRFVTGGDDNALGLVAWDGESLLVVDFVPSAASSTVTGVAMVDGSHVATTGADQMVRVWEVDTGLREIAAAYTTVADTGCIAYHDKTVYVGGAGLSLWGWSSKREAA